MKTYRPTICEIDLSAIRYNLKRIRGYIPGSTKVMAVVKANAYGHGIVEVSDVLNKAGVDYLGVATVDEALAIRRSGIKAPILILGSILLILTLLSVIINAVDIVLDVLIEEIKCWFIIGTC